MMSVQLGKAWEASIAERQVKFVFSVLIII